MKPTIINIIFAVVLLLGKIYPNIVPQLNFDPDIFDASWIKKNHFEKECQILESLIKRLPGITLDNNHKEIHKINNLSRLMRLISN